MGNSRLGIPPLHLEDGPQGVADGVPQVTAYPSALSVTASWDEELMALYGSAMGTEQRIKGSNIMLGPMVNLARVPQGGRNFESMGEDPHLAGRMAAAVVTGIQSTGVMGCVKHFVDNNQEQDRGSVSANIDERTQHELYYPAFNAAVQAGVASVMCSYNKVNNVYACENNDTLTTGLKEGMGYEGFVMSDWGGTHSTVQAALAGLDMEMPDGGFFGPALAQAVVQGTVPQARLDDMVLRILTSMFAVGIMDTPQTGNLSADATSSDRSALARTLAAAGTVLLQNKNSLLPLNPKALTSIAVIGDQTTVTGGGSGGVITPYVITPMDGIAGFYNHDRPVQCTYDQDYDYYQPGNPAVPADSKEDCCKQCTTRACSFFTFVNGTCWLKQTNAGRTYHQGLVSGACAPYHGPNLTYASGDDIQAAVNLARSADVAIVVVATSSSEGGDRKDLSLGKWDAIAAAVTAAQPHTVVVVRAPGAATMPWATQAGAIVLQFMPGQEAGNALADVLFGVVNPGGKLPVTFPNALGETWLQSPTQYPGVDLQTSYSEKLLMGYRWYDAKALAPLFPFGHGLSYTTFAYSGLAVSGSLRSSGVLITCTVLNSGSVAGAEVAQLYISFPASAGEPPQLLRGFQKVSLDAGAADVVAFKLVAQDLSVWDEAGAAWALVHGTFGIAVGSSSRDIRLRGSFTV